MNVRLPFGKTQVELDLSGINTTVLEPRFVAGLDDEKGAFFQACDSPIGANQLKESIESGDRVAILIPDATRPFPSHRVLPWLMEAIDHVAKENVVIINGTGSHRGNTPEELIAIM